MTSKFKALTGRTQPLSLDGDTGVLAQPSLQSANSDNTPNSTQTTKMQSETTLTTELKGSDNTPTTPKITEKLRQHAMLMRVALLQLEKTGLLKRYKVLSKDKATVKEIQVVFSPDLWTIGLRLKVLSDDDNSGQQ